QGVNDPPVVFPQNLNSPEDTALLFQLNGDDGDAEVTQTLTYAIATNPQHGTILNFNPATGRGTYIPANNYNGPDSFTVTMTDDSTAGPPGPLTSNPAVISIAVTRVNDQPIATSAGVSGPEDTSITIHLAGDDGDPEVTQ